MSKPRFLTKKEIDDVVEALPTIMAATKKCADTIRQQIQNTLREQLKDIQLVPKGIAKLKEYIVSQHYNSLVAPGEPVGIRAAETVSQPITQMSLDSFHQSGKEGMEGTGINSIKELYNMSQKRAIEIVTLHFKNKNYVYEDVFDLKKYLVGISVKDLKGRKEEIFAYSELQKPKDYWYEFYKDLMNKPIPKCTAYLRYYFDKTKLYTYNLTPQDIANKIESEKITCIPSPASEGIIDFYPNDDMIMEFIGKKDTNLNFNEENTSTLFLQLYFIDSLAEIINGIEGIRDIKPLRQPVLSLIPKEGQEELGDNRWRINIDTVKEHVEGFPREKLRQLIEYCKIKIIEEQHKYFIVEMPSKNYLETALLAIPFEKPEDRVKINSPQQFMSELIKNDENLRKEKTEEEKKNRIFRRQEISDLGKLSHYISAVTNGTNLVKVLAHPLIDTRYTKSNNPREMLKALGIEGARNFLILEYIKNFELSKVDARHVLLCADFQTSLGDLLSITSRSASRQQTGPLARSSFEHPMNAFLEAAAFGKYEEVKNTSTSIFVGKRMILGTGSFKARLDKEAIDKAKAIQDSIQEKDYDIFDNPNQIFDFRDVQIKGINLNHTEDMIGDFPIIDEVTSGPVFEKLKFKNPVPLVSYSGLDFPNVVNILLRRVSRVKSPSRERAMSPKRHSLSKRGLPAIPEMTPLELVSKKKEKKTSTIDLESFLEDEEFAF